MVIEVPPGLQGILDDFFQRPICSDGQIEGRSLVRRRRPARAGPRQGRQVPDAAAGLHGHAAGRVISRFARAPMACSSSGAGSSRIRKHLADAGRGHGADAHLSARQEGQREADAVPERIGDARQHAVSAGRQRVRHAASLHRARSMSIPPTWKCAACWPRSASSRASRSRPTPARANCSTRPRAPPTASPTPSRISRRRS